VGLSIMALTAIRFVIVIGPVGGAVAAVALAASLRRVPALQRMRSSLAFVDRPPRTQRQARFNLALAAIVAGAGVTMATLRVLPETHEAAIGDAMPARATAWLAGKEQAHRIFNVHAWGGYLGRELPRSRVYIDGRSDVYGDALIREYAESIALERDPFVLLDREEIDTVVFWPRSRLAGVLDRSPKWERTYSDKQAAIWVRRTGG